MRLEYRPSLATHLRHGNGKGVAQKMISKI